MRIIWNSTEQTFEAQLAVSGWTEEQKAVKLAGFKTSGPPQWIWYCKKATQLLKLKELKPIGITIHPDALANFIRLKTTEAANQVVKDQLAAAKKQQKKEQKEAQKEADRLQIGKPEDVIHGEFTYFKVDPGEPTFWKSPIFTPPDTRCTSCGTPVYHYELQDPPTCLDCEFF